MLLAALLPCLAALVAASPVPAVPAVTSKGAIHLPARRHHLSRSKLVDSLSQPHLQARNADSCSEPKHSASVKAGLTNVWNGLGFFVDIEIDGTPLTVNADTGSPQLWVPGFNCTTCKTFGMKSLTDLPHSNDVERMAFIQYGSGNVTGHLTTASGSIGGLTLGNIGVLAADAIDSVMGKLVKDSNGVVEGILGLSPRINFDPTIPELLYRQGSITAPLLGFFLGSSSSAGDAELTIGDVTKSKWFSSAKYVTLNQTAVNGAPNSIDAVSFYSVVLDNIALGTNVTKAAPNTVVIMDTGTSGTMLPAPLAQHAVDVLFGSAAKSINGTFAAPCDFQSNHTVSLGFGGLQWPMKPESLVLPHEKLEAGLCLLGIQAMDAGLGVQGIIGDTFLNSVYSVFNFKTMGVSLHALPETSAGN